MGWSVNKAQVSSNILNLSSIMVALFIKVVEKGLGKQMYCLVGPYTVFLETFMDTIFRVFYMTGIFAETNFRAIIVTANFANIKLLW